MLKTFRASQYLYEKGADAAEVFRVVEGTVEIVRRIGRGQVLIGTVEPGGYVGALGLLLGQPRGTTAQAATPVSAEALTREEFIHQLRGDPDAAEALIVRAGARLRGADDPLLEALKAEFDGGWPEARAAAGPEVSPGSAADVALMERPADEAPAPAGLPTIEIKAASDGLIALIGAGPVRVTRLPFMVGRTADEGEQDMIVEPDLPLRDPPPHHLSRRHFLLFAKEGALFLRDLESTLGTTVNGEPIGRKFETKVAALAPGDNRVTAGDALSSYAFVITIR